MRSLCSLDSWDTVYEFETESSEILLQRVRSTKMFAKQQKEYPIDKVLETIQKFHDHGHISEDDARSLEQHVEKLAAVAKSACAECARLKNELAVARPKMRTKHDPHVSSLENEINFEFQCRLFNDTTKQKWHWSYMKILARIPLNFQNFMMYSEN